ncbi:phage tail protein [Paenibacillus rigui]|uniref:Phage tail protein n=1 Tax=Paenibacillus rigui TaxID=554312 RepID=A0A229UMF1_9BACL|nr:phage tail protein [Paenibacillus rigui]OXM84606.1 phage tail protein [Paenibacillus rigui]
MTIIRGATSLTGLPPGLYINELAVPQSDEVATSDFVLGFVGDFDRGPVNQYVMINEIPTKRLAEIAEPVLGATTKSNAGNALLDHLDRAKVKRAVFVRVLGAGYAAASITLQDRQGTPADTLKVAARYPGTYGNVFTCQVAAGTNANTFKMILVSDFGTETYDNLSMDPDDGRYAPTLINGLSAHFYLTDLNSTASTRLLAQPAVKAQSQLAGGSNGAALTDADRIGSIDSGTGARTGLKLLELVGNIVTDVAFADYSSATADAALAAFGLKYNTMTYCGIGSATTVATAITARSSYDSDFMQMVFGRYQSVGSQWTSGACLSAIVHAIGNVEDSGIAVECTWVSGTDKGLDFDDFTNLYTNQIAAFQLKPSAAGDGTMAWRLANDYTLAKTDVSGAVISDDENRKVNKRRLNSWIEKSLESVAAPWQGKAMTKKMKDDAERRVRTYFDLLKSPTNPLVSSKFEDYSVTFNSAAQSIDQFVQDIKVKHYNTAEWILLNFQGGTNVEVG